MLFGQFPYCAAIKTIDAEIKGVENLSDSVIRGTLPLIELTRSRRTKIDRIGDIRKRASQIRRITDNRPFILDVSVHPDLSNPQLEDLLDDEDGFRNWCTFLEDFESPGIIPVVHVVEDGSPQNLDREIRHLEDRYGRVAFRADAFDIDTVNYVEQIFGALRDQNNITIILDANLIHAYRWNDVVPVLDERIREIYRVGTPDSVVILSSSFPRSVLEYGEDDNGTFPLSEIMLSNSIIERHHEKNIVHGDYGGIHPRRYESGGGWVPRIDIPLDEEIYYYRYRREDGGYRRCAFEAVNDEYYTSIDAWGDDEVQAAASGDIHGRSPAHWIAVRLNLHVTRQFNRTSRGR